MKKIIFILLILFISVSLLGCGKKEVTTSSYEPPTLTIFDDDYKSEVIDDEPYEYEDPYRLNDAEDFLFNVDSSCFSRIGYDAETQTMWVEFRKSGRIYTYFNFPLSEWDRFSSAPSLGRYYNTYIKGQY